MSPEPFQLQDTVRPYAPVVLKLLQGVIYSDDFHWDRLQSSLSQVSRDGQLNVKRDDLKAFPSLKPSEV